MAEMIINIINPNINLISKTSKTSNSCEDVIEFTVQSTPYANVIVAIYTKRYRNPDPLRPHSYDTGDGFEDFGGEYIQSYPDFFPEVTDETEVFRMAEFQLGESGEALVRFQLGNSGSEGNYKTANVLVKDETNNEEKRTSFTRFNDSDLCVSGEQSIAVDDEFNVFRESETVLDVLNNDEKLSNYGNDVVIESQPSHGVISLTYANAKVKYKHNVGDTDTSDTFSYSINNYKGDSNIATVTINISEFPEQPEKNINNNTKLNILYDESGSMSHTIEVLNDITEVGGALYNKLAQYYDSDEDYFSAINFSSYSSEKTLLALTDFLDSSKDNINLVFQDEAHPVYHGGNGSGWTINSPLTSTFKQDMSTLRNRLSNYDEITYNGIVFAIGSSGSKFIDMFEAIKQEEGRYIGDYSLKDFRNINIKTGVIEGNNKTYFSNDEEARQYYADLIVTSLEELGYII